MSAKLILLVPLIFIFGNSMAQENQDEYHNPVDKKTYVAPGGWKTYKPQKGTQSSTNKKVTMKEVRLLNTQDDFKERASVTELANFLKEVEGAATSVFSSSSTSSQILVQFKSMPNKTELQIAHRGEISNDLLQKFYERVLALTPVKVSHGELNYQVEYDVMP